MSCGWRKTGAKVVFYGRVAKAWSYNLPGWFS